jgi:hypothetical protein
VSLEGGFEVTVPVEGKESGVAVSDGGFFSEEEDNDE